MKTANSQDIIERAFKLGQPIDDAVKRAIQLAKKSADSKSKRSVKPRAPQKSK
jgi:hypothetical protein